MNKKISLGAAIAVMLIVASVTFSMTMIYARNNFNDRVYALKEREDMFEKFTEIDREVRQNYYYTINENQLMDSVAEGYVNGIGDDYAVYITAEEYKKLTETDEGENAGIGAVISVSADDYYLVVDEVYADSPAQAAGIEAGDLIVKVDDTDLTRENSTQMLSAIEGPQGTQVTLVVRKGSEESTLNLTRRAVSIPTVYSRMIPDTSVGYIRIIEFADRTSDQFTRELQRLTEAGAKSLIFDLRDNKGGVLRSATRILDQLLPEGIIVSATYKDGTNVVIATSDANEVDLPMVALINGETASAAELFAQSLKDFNKGRTVGSLTMGKGVMQQVIRLKDGSAIDLTVAQFQPNSGVTFDGVGVKPDFDVAQEGDWTELDEDTDQQLKKAIEVAVGMQTAVVSGTELPQEDAEESSGGEGSATAEESAEESSGEESSEEESDDESSDDESSDEEDESSEEDE